MYIVIQLIGGIKGIVKGKVSAGDRCVGMKKVELVGCVTLCSAGEKMVMDTVSKEVLKTITDSRTSTVSLMGPERTITQTDVLRQTVAESLVERTIPTSTPGMR